VEHSWQTSSKKTDKSIKDLSYEEAMTELEEIVESLEGEQGPLDDAMKLFERGQELVARCSELLEAAQLKVQQLAGESLIPFEDESE
jgi:exodeoxyribonuclease VII small subunit